MIRYRKRRRTPLDYMPGQAIFATPTVMRGGGGHHYDGQGYMEGGVIGYDGYDAEYDGYDLYHGGGPYNAYNNLEYGSYRYTDYAPYELGAYPLQDYHGSEHNTPASQKLSSKCDPNRPKDDEAGKYA
ncbi:hypothetical protein BGZ49_010594 [Haplosporangium sp. Z 27]|nr:hypothetical protein BGZ49_010594 [Haplosporangium sp. Z 27]